MGTPSLAKQIPRNMSSGAESDGHLQKPEVVI